jgi:Family of unknown function (DUF6275)
MTEETPAGTQGVKFAVPSPSMLGERKYEKSAAQDPDRYLSMAKKLVADNYNASHNSSRTPSLSLDDVYIIWFTKLLASWKAVVASTAVRGLVWIVSYNGPRNEAYVEVYKRVNNVTVRTEKMP